MERCIRDAIFHIDCAKQALEASLEDPVAWAQDSDHSDTLIARLLPLMTLMSVTLPRIHNPEPSPFVESSQEEHFEDPSTSYSSEPASNSEP
jgi:hypothetical protein